MKRIVKLMMLGLLVTAVALFSLFYPGEVSFAQSDGATRKIMLEPVEGCTRCGISFLAGVPSRSNVTVHSNRTVHVDLTGLQQIPVGNAYGLYFTTRAHPEDGGHSPYFYVFNMDWDGRAAFWAADLPPDIPFDEPTITVFITEEFDDGRSFDPTQDMARVQMIGTSTR